MSALPPKAPNDFETPNFEHLQQAAVWFSVLEGDASTEAERLQWQHWLDSGPGQRAAWQRVEAVAGEFVGLAGLPARQTLERSVANSRRRTALRALAVVPVAGLAGWLASRELPWGGCMATYRTRIGERCEILLADGSRIWLNTASAFDIDFSSNVRRIVLHQGEIMVTSGHLDAFSKRPLVIEVPQGRLTALGTRFSVRREEGKAVRLAVLEGAVEARQRDGSMVRTLVAGQQALVFSEGVGASEVSDDGASYADDWTRGMLVANGMRLGDFITELGRYQAGYLGCAPEVAYLRIVGAYPLANTDRILDALQATLPVKVQRPMPWWTVVAAGPERVRR